MKNKYETIAAVVFTLYYATIRFGTPTMTGTELVKYVGPLWIAMFCLVWVFVERERNGLEKAT